MMDPIDMAFWRNELHWLALVICAVGGAVVAAQYATVCDLSGRAAAGIGWRCIALLVLLLAAWVAAA